MTFDDIIGKITQVDIIARGVGVDARQALNRKYGHGNGRKFKGILHAEALAAGKSVSALLRQWIDERLDLPEQAAI